MAPRERGRLATKVTVLVSEGIEGVMQIEISQLEFKYAALRVVSRARESRLTASILEQGQQIPVLVVPGAESRVYVLIDGYARVSALRSLAEDTVEAVVLEVAESEALILSHRLETSRRRTALEVSWLLRELVETHGLGQREVAVRLHRSASWVSRMLAMVRVLPASVQEAVRRGVIPAQAAMKYLVPLARANAEHSELLVKGLGSKPISVRQAERLYVGWRSGDAEQQQRIVEHPHLYLDADAASQPEPAVPPGDPAEPMVNDLESIAAICRRARRRVREGDLAPILDASRRAVSRSFEEARLAFDSLAVLVEGFRDAGPRHESRHLALAEGGTRDPSHRPVRGRVTQCRTAGDP